MVYRLPPCPNELGHWGDGRGGVFLWGGWDLQLPGPQHATARLFSHSVLYYDRGLMDAGGPSDLPLLNEVFKKGDDLCQLSKKS